MAIIAKGYNAAKTNAVRWPIFELDFSDQTKDYTDKNLVSAMVTRALASTGAITRHNNVARATIDVNASGVSLRLGDYGYHTTPTVPLWYQQYVPPIGSWQNNVLAAYGPVPFPKLVELTCTHIAPTTALNQFGIYAFPVSKGYSYLSSLLTYFKPWSARTAEHDRDQGYYVVGLGGKKYTDNLEQYLSYQVAPWLPARTVDLSVDPRDPKWNWDFDISEKFYICIAAPLVLRGTNSGNYAYSSVPFYIKHLKIS